MHIHAEIHNSVLVWQINRPDRRNALGTILAQELWEKTEQLARSFAEAQAAAAARPAPRLLVVKTKPHPADESPIWIAGGDLKELSLLKDPREGRRYAETMAKVCEALYHLPIPVLALIDGLVIGGGIEFSLAADLRFATSRTVFHYKQLELGLATAYGSAARLTQLVGVSRAMNWLLRSQHVGAQDALAAGLLHEVVATPEALDELAEGFARHLETLPFHGIEAQKAMLHAGGFDSARQQAELDRFESLWMQDAHQEKLDAFLTRPKAGPKDAAE